MFISLILTIIDHNVSSYLIYIDYESVIMTLLYSWRYKQKHTCYLDGVSDKIIYTPIGRKLNFKSNFIVMTVVDFK